MYEIIEVSPPVSGDAIRVLESFIGFGLPKDYCQFLSQSGGGYPDPDSFRFLGEKEGSSVQRFYGLNRKDSYDFVKNFNCYLRRIPRDCISIACDPGGNQVCLTLKGTDRGRVYFWDHELEKDEDPDYSNMILIANSFNDFLNGLYDSEF